MPSNQNSLKSHWSYRHHHHRRRHHRRHLYRTCGVVKKHLCICTNSYAYTHSDTHTHTHTVTHKHTHTHHSLWWIYIGCRTTTAWSTISMTRHRRRSRRIRNIIMLDTERQVQICNQDTHTHSYVTLASMKASDTTLLIPRSIDKKATLLIPWKKDTD